MVESGAPPTDLTLHDLSNQIQSLAAMLQPITTKISHLETNVARLDSGLSVAGSDIGTLTQNLQDYTRQLEKRIDDYATTNNITMQSLADRVEQSELGGGGGGGGAGAVAFSVDPHAEINVTLSSITLWSWYDRWYVLVASSEANFSLFRGNLERIFLPLLDAKETHEFGTHLDSLEALLLTPFLPESARASFRIIRNRLAFWHTLTSASLASALGVSDQLNNAGLHPEVKQAKTLGALEHHSAKVQLAAEVNPFPLRDAVGEGGGRRRGRAPRGKGGRVGQ